MSDLKKNIVDKYNAEVKPEFTPAAWDSFLAYQNRQEQPDDRKKRFIFWFFIGGLLLIGTLLGYHLTIQKVDNQAKTNLMADSVAKSTENGKDLQQVSQNNISSEHQNTANDDNSNKITSNLNKSIYTEEPESTFVPFIKKARSSNHVNDGDSTVDHLEIDNKDQDIIKTAQIEHLLQIESKSIYPELDMQREITLEFDRKINPLHRVQHQSGFSLSLAGGHGQMFHRSLKNAEQRIFEMGIQYQFDKKWTVVSFAALQFSEFKSRVQNLSLGIRSVPLPRSTMSLQQVTSKTTYFETGFGIEYNVYFSDKMKAAFGPRMRYVKEISRNLTYEFSDSDNQTEEIHSSLDELNSHPVNLDLNGSLYYQMKRDLEVGIMASYIRSIRNDAVILPNQWRLSAGLLKKF